MPADAPGPRFRCRDIVQVTSGDDFLGLIGVVNMEEINGYVGVETHAALSSRQTQTVLISPDHMTHLSDGRAVLWPDGTKAEG